MVDMHDILEKIEQEQQKNEDFKNKRNSILKSTTELEKLIEPHAKKYDENDVKISEIKKEMENSEYALYSKEILNTMLSDSNVSDDKKCTIKSFLTISKEIEELEKEQKSTENFILSYEKEIKTKLKEFVEIFDKERKNLETIGKIYSEQIEMLEDEQMALQASYDVIKDKKSAKALELSKKIQENESDIKYCKTKLRRIKEKTTDYQSTYEQMQEEYKEEYKKDIESEKNNEPASPPINNEAKTPSGQPTMKSDEVKTTPDFHRNNQDNSGKISEEEASEIETEDDNINSLWNEISKEPLNKQFDFWMKIASDKHANIGELQYALNFLNEHEPSEYVKMDSFFARKSYEYRMKKFFKSCGQKMPHLETIMENDIDGIVDEISEFDEVSGKEVRSKMGQISDMYIDEAYELPTRYSNWKEIESVILASNDSTTDAYKWKTQVYAMCEEAIAKRYEKNNERAENYASFRDFKQKADIVNSYTKAIQSYSTYMLSQGKKLALPEAKDKSSGLLVRLFTQKENVKQTPQDELLPENMGFTPKFTRDVKEYKRKPIQSVLEEAVKGDDEEIYIDIEDFIEGQETSNIEKPTERDI